MHIVLGATGNVGSSVVKYLLAEGEQVLAVTHDPSHVPQLEKTGAEVAVADIRDSEALAKVFARGDSLFILNPPGDVHEDSSRMEKETARMLIDAVAASNIQKIVAESTQGAQSGDNIGDFGPLYELEQGLRELGRNVRITRVSYYMSNWDMQAQSAKDLGVIESFFPRDFKLPMVSPDDLGLFNAELMISNFTGFQVIDFTGPEDYTAEDVATEFARIYGHEVKVSVIPRNDFEAEFRHLEFSEASAKSYAAMTRMTLDLATNPADNPERGATGLREYFVEKFGSPQGARGATPELRA